MATPTITDFVLYVATPLTNSDWAYNWTKLVSCVTDGTEDFTINSLTTTDDITVGGDADITGTLTAGSLAGDGSGITNLAGIYVWSIIGGS